MLVYDTYLEHFHGVDFSKDLGTAQGCQSVYTGMYLKCFN